MPPSGQVVWFQPSFVSGAGQTRWMGGLKRTIEPPPEAKPIQITFRHVAGSFPVDLKSKGIFKGKESGESHSVLFNIETNLTENTQAITPQGATLEIGIKRFVVGHRIDNRPPPPIPAVQDIGKAKMIQQVDNRGVVVRSRTDMLRVPRSSREELETFCTQITESLEAVSVPLPDSPMLQPNQTWTSTRRFTVDTMLKPLPALIDMTYRYAGVRTQDGRQLAVIILSGRVRPARAVSFVKLAGSVRGSVNVDVATGKVVRGQAYIDARIDIRLDRHVLNTSGTIDVKVTRKVN